MRRTGVFAYFAVGSLVRHHYAALRFASTEGVILSSKVKTSSDGDGSTYAPKIKYRYTVAGQEYVGEQYDYVGGSSSDGSYARRAVSENPPGKAVTVYYNPGNPSEAILHLAAPGGQLLHVAVSPAVLPGWTDADRLVCGAAVRRQTTEAIFPPRCLSALGYSRLGRDGSGFRRAGSAGTPKLVFPLGHFLLGYGLTCFASIFVVGFLFHGFGDVNVGVVRWAFIVAGCVGAAALLRKTFWPAAEAAFLSIRSTSGLPIHSRRRDLGVPLDQIKGLRLRQIRYPGKMAVNGQTVRYLLLEAEIGAGQSMPMHAFKWQAGRQDQVQAVAHRAQSLLARLIGCPVIKSVADDEPEQPDPPPSPVQAGSQLTGLFALLPRRQLQRPDLKSINGQNGPAALAQPFSNQTVNAPLRPCADGACV